MSIFEEWNKPFPKLRPISYLITDNEFHDDIRIELSDISKSLWTIMKRDKYLRKSDVVFIGLDHSSIYSHLKDFTFPSIELVGEFYQENIDKINQLSHRHKDYKPINIK